jgi:predicted adenine nucleotide alpha hydrolase (AANH) superfamily ATPase
MNDIWDEPDPNIDTDYNPYINNYVCEKGAKLNIETGWCCFECERERMKYKSTNKRDPLQLYWDTLELSPPKTLQEIKQQYHKMIKKHHPDKGGDSNKFIEIQNSYNTLILAVS